jgi:hypothetical protein
MSSFAFVSLLPWGWIFSFSALLLFMVITSSLAWFSRLFCCLWLCLVAEVPRSFLFSVAFFVLF